MSEIKKDHVLGAGTGGLAAGAIGAAAGSVLGPGGMVVGAVLGGAAGALAGDKVAEQMDTRGDIGRFEQISHSMPYFVRGMEWEDYRPAYQHGLGLAQRGQVLDWQSFPQAWEVIGADSALEAGQAWAAVEHAWRKAHGLPGPDEASDV